ncbi:hypothetical protein RSOL_021450, partial [Rhizoctonia solani AG-3 Rhs1AP]
MPASSSKSTAKGKARAGASTKSTPKAAGKHSRQVGAVKWMICEYPDLFRIIAVICPLSQNDWKVVSAQHNEGSTNQSAEACKGHWTPVLKLPKPTGRSKSHLLYGLALSIDAHINKKNATYMMNDQGEPDLHSELEDEFQFAETEMKRLKLDFNHPPNFSMPMPDEDAVADDEENGMEVDGGSEVDEGGAKGEDAEEDREDREQVEENTKGNGDQGDFRGVILDAEHNIRHTSEAPTELEAIELHEPGALHPSSSWDLQSIPDLLIPPAPKTPMFPQSKSPSARAEPRSKLVNADSSASKPLEKIPANPAGTTAVMNTISLT